MGIEGLLKVFSSVQTKHNISEYKGQTIGVDTYCWIHKAISVKAHEIMSKNDVSLFIPHVLSQIKILLYHNIKPIMVFDGGKLLSKEGEEASREEKRNLTRTKAQELLKAGEKEKAERKFIESLDVTPEIAFMLLKAIRKNYDDVLCIVSPYEADAQLAYLSRIGLVDAVITEDSDLLCFGAKKVLYKFNDSRIFENNSKGDLMEINLKDWNLIEDWNFKDWNFDQFLSLCILSGCDYLPSLKSVGLKTAYKVLSESRTIDNVFKKWKQNPKYGFTDDYQDKFYKAYLTFKFQRVFCPVKRKIVHVNDLDLQKFENNLKAAGNGNSLGRIMGNYDFLTPIMLSKLKTFQEKDPGLEFLGKEINEKIACDIADGKINFTNLKPYEEKTSLYETEFNFNNEPGKERKVFSLEFKKTYQNNKLPQNEVKSEENQEIKEATINKSITWKKNDIQSDKLKNAVEVKNGQNMKDDRKSGQFFGQNSLDLYMKKKAQENASRIKPQIKDENISKCSNGDDFGFLSQIKNIKITETSKNNENLFEPKKSNEFGKQPNQKDILCFFKSEKIENEEKSQIEDPRKNNGFGKKPYQKDILNYFKRERPEIEENAASDFSLNSTKVKTPKRPKTNGGKSVMLQTPEMIDKLKLKDYILKPNPLKREINEDLDYKIEKNGFESRKKIRNDKEEEFKVWDFKNIKKIQIKQLEITEIRKEFRGGKPEKEREIPINSAFFNVMSQLFKPLFP